uniref:C2 DOCK-type domain-containing protein n=1 Tax=Haemonchus placei TaxID=6290 RepID=A0A0N4W8D9_HAEPC
LLPSHSDNDKAVEQGLFCYRKVTIRLQVPERLPVRILNNYFCTAALTSSVDFPLDEQPSNVSTKTPCSTNWLSFLSTSRSHLSTKSTFFSSGSCWNNGEKLDAIPQSSSISTISLSSSLVLFSGG